MRVPAKCGTLGGYRRHRRRREETCRPCRDAQNAYHAAQYRQQSQLVTEARSKPRPEPDYQPWPTVPPRCSACRHELGDCTCRDWWFTQHEQETAA